MARKILAYTLIVLSSILLIASLIGVGAAWFYNEPLTRVAITRLREVDASLSQIQTDLDNARLEVERALRIIESAEKALASLTQQTTDAAQLLDEVNQTLDEDLIPGLVTTREKIDGVRTTLEDLRSALEQVNSLPFVNLNVPGDELLGNIIAGVDSLDSEIVNVQDLAQRASVFVSDTSYLLGGDFNETKQHLEELLLVLKDYDQKTTDWRAQVGTLIESVPRWIDNASISITVLLLWFGLSQFGLILHGLNIRRGDNPLEVLRKAP